MKIQDLAIIFLIIIIPISIVLSAYTQFQINTINMQTVYDTKLTSATYDAIKAFQVNTANSTMSDLSNSKMRDIEASISTFRNSIMSTFGLNGYTEDELNNYIPALVYTMYDGFYIYSPYQNNNYLYETKADGSKVPAADNGSTLYGLKPYITYSCSYIKGNIDVIITYSLDNFISIQGTINGKYVNDEGYLIDGITKDANGNIIYNGIQITTDQNLKENVGNIKRNGNYVEFPYIKLNGTKYYYDDGGTADVSDDSIFYLSNGQITQQGDYKGQKAAQYYNDVIKNNSVAIQYYTKAYEFTQRVKNYGLSELTYDDALEITPEKDADGNYKSDGNNLIYSKQKIWAGDTRKIFDFNNDTSKPDKNIECELSNFNQHRLAIIRHKIEQNLSIAIANYNKYSISNSSFQMPELKEDEWNSVMDNISLISFVQGLYIGGKIYNGYAIVNNSESKEVVQEENIFILGTDGYYHRIGDNYLNDGSHVESSIPAGRLNLDFKRNNIIDTSTNTRSIYYYPLVKYNASYTSIVTQNDVTTYEDIYAYINSTNTNVKKAFYQALGRERGGQYNASNDSAFDYNVLIIGYAPAGNDYEAETQRLTNFLNTQTYIKATYFYSSDSNVITNYIRQQKNNYKLILLDSFAWNLPVNDATLTEITNATNLLTISNDASGISILGSSQNVSNRTASPVITSKGIEKFVSVRVNGTFSDSSQNMIKFRDGVTVLYEANYNGYGKYDAIGFWDVGSHNWIHSQLSLSVSNNSSMIERLVYYAMYGL